MKLKYKSTVAVALLSLMSIGSSVTIYLQDFSASGSEDLDIGGSNPGGTIVPTSGTFVPGENGSFSSGSSATQATDGDYTVNWSLSGGDANTQFTLNNPNGVVSPSGLDTSTGLAVRNTANFTFETGAIPTTYGSLIVRVTTANNTSEDVILGSVGVHDDGNELNLCIEWASDAGDLQVGGNEAVNVSFNLAGAGFVSLGDLTENFGGTNNDSTEGFIKEEILIIPEPTSAALLGLGGLALVGRRRRS